MIRLGVAVALVALTAVPARAEVHGSFVAGSRFYPEEASLGRDLEWDLGGELELSARSRSLRGLIRPRFRWDPLDGGRTRWIPREAWIEETAGPWRVRLGRQVLSWGSADTWNPTDVLARVDWGSDFVDPERPGEWAAVVTRGAPRWGVEAAVLPVLEGVDFPSARSPWSLENAARRGLGFDPGPLDLIETPRLPAGASAWTFGARARLTAGATDLYLVGVSGVDRSPVLTAVPAPGLNLAGLRPVATYLPLHLAGIEAQSAVGDLLLKGALTWRDQSTADTLIAGQVFGDFGLRAHSVQGVFGMEYLMADAFGRPWTLDLNLEFLVDTAPREESLLVYRPFQRDLAATVTWLLGDLANTTVEVGWIHDLEVAEGGGTVRIRRRLAGSLTGEVGGDWIYGSGASSQSPFALFAPNDRVRVRLEQAF